MLYSTSGSTAFALKVTSTLFSPSTNLNEYVVPLRTLSLALTESISYPSLGVIVSVTVWPTSPFVLSAVTVP